MTNYSDDGADPATLKAGANALFLDPLGRCVREPEAMGRTDFNNSDL